MLRRLWSRCQSVTKRKESARSARGGRRPHLAVVLHRGAHVRVEHHKLQLHVRGPGGRATGCVTAWLPHSSRARLPAKPRWIRPCSHATARHSGAVSPHSALQLVSMSSSGFGPSCRGPSMARVYFYQLDPAHRRNTQPRAPQARSPGAHWYGTHAPPESSWMSSSTAITSVMRYQRGCGPSAGAPACRCRSAPARSTPRPWNAQRVSSAANAALPARSALRGARAAGAWSSGGPRDGARAAASTCARRAARMGLPAHGSTGRRGTARAPHTARRRAHPRRKQKAAPAPAAWRPPDSGLLARLTQQPDENAAAAREPA